MLLSNFQILQKGVVPVPSSYQYVEYNKMHKDTSSTTTKYDELRELDESFPHSGSPANSANWPIDN